MLVISEAKEEEKPLIKNCVQCASTEEISPKHKTHNF